MMAAIPKRQRATFSLMLTMSRRDFRIGNVLRLAPERSRKVSCLASGRVDKPPLPDVSARFGVSATPLGGPAWYPIPQVPSRQVGLSEQDAVSLPAFSAYQAGARQGPQTDLSARRLACRVGKDRAATGAIPRSGFGKVRGVGSSHAEHVTRSHGAAARGGRQPR